MENEYPYYLYLHVNGQVITKPRIVCETNTTPKEYFEGPFVVEWWKIESQAKYNTVMEKIRKLKEELTDG